MKKCMTIVTKIPNIIKLERLKVTPTICWHNNFLLLKKLFKNVNQDLKGINLHERPPVRFYLRNLPLAPNLK